MLAGFALIAAVATPQAAEKSGSDDVFARVGDTVISQRAYDEAFAAAARSKFYHGKPPEGAVAVLQREVGNKLVDDVLLLSEARRRKIQPNQAEIAKQLDEYERRYGKSPQWQATKAQAVPALKKKFEEQSLLDQLKAQVRKVPQPSDKQVQAYYDQHRDKFTEPEQVKVSMILLKVDPSSPQAKWNAAMEEGAAISRRLRSGANFAELARMHSGDGSAQKGGDMGYLHRGMMPDPAQAAIDKLKPGQISDAVALLEGVAVFRLDERKSARLNPLPAVRERAEDLLERDLADQAWSDFVAKLRRSAQVKIDESRFLPLSPTAAASKPSR